LPFSSIETAFSKTILLVPLSLKVKSKFETVSVPVKCKSPFNSSELSAVITFTVSPLILNEFR